MVAKSIPTFALGGLPRVLIEEYQSLHDSDIPVVDLREELKRTQQLLEDLDSEQHVQGNIIQKIADVREYSFDLENAIEEFVVSDKIKRSFKKGKLVKLISSFKSKILDLNESIERIGIRRTTRTQIPNNHISSVVIDDFVGREKDIEKLVSLLVDDKESKVIAIYGMGGLGKTTLAKKLYQNHEVRGHFEGLSLVHISPNFELSRVSRRIIGELSKDLKETVEETTDLHELYDHLGKVLSKKKCLVVLDDVWALENVLKFALGLVSGTHSKILVTTRSKGAADEVYWYQLLGLSDEHSWELFSKRALAQKDVIDNLNNTEMKKIGQNLIKWCQGLPLAIQVLGGLLVNKHTLREWERVQERLNSGPKSEEFSHLHEEVATVLSLSYADLPYRLKPCFLHLANFSSGTNSYRERLIYSVHVYCMWIAEGLVLPEDCREGETMVDVSHRYMNELRIRSMVQQVDQGPSSTFIMFYLHDLMWELCILKATEDGFISQISIEDQHELINSNAATRLTVDMGKIIGMSPKIGDGKNLKSLVLFADELMNGIPNLLEFRALKVLYICGFNFEKHNILNSIQNLIHVRFICFDGCSSLKLPSSLGNLPYLQFLMFDLCNKIFIPDILWKLKRLVHLALPELCDVKQKLQLHGFLGLESLVDFDPSFCRISDLANLTDLKDLSVHVTKVDDDELPVIIECLRSSFSKPLRYSELHLDIFNSDDSESYMQLLPSCSKLDVLQIEGPIVDFPEEICFLQNLSMLVLDDTELEDDDFMEILKNLPKLESLQLLGDAFVGTKMICQASGFHQLKFLQLLGLSKLRQWRIKKGAFPSLETLGIGDCPRLRMLPTGLKYITSLKIVSFFEMPEAFLNRLRMTKGDEGEDYYKISHVPSIIIR